MLEAELESTKERLEDQKAQHKSQCRVLQSQTLSLEEQNSLLERKLQELSQNQSIRRNRGCEPLQPNHRPDSIPSTDTGPTQPTIQVHTTRNPLALYTPSQNTLHFRDPTSILPYQVWTQRYNYSTYNLHVRVCIKVSNIILGMV